MLSGDNGILQKATTAKTETEKGQEEDIIALAYNSALAKKVSNGDSTPVTANNLNEELTNQGASADGSDPIKVTFTVSKRQYTINSNGIITYAGIKNGDEQDDNELPTALGTKPYFPSDKFKQLEGTDLTTGLVITDQTTGNQFVWIEVPNDGTGPNYTGVEDSTDYTNIESALQNYISSYGNTNDTYYEGCGLSDENAYNALKQKMLKSIYENGGFWIGRYETGIENGTLNISRYYYLNWSSFPPVETEVETAQEMSEHGGKYEATWSGGTAVVKKDAIPYNFVTVSQAQYLANSINSGNCTSSLMFDIQYQLTLKYIQIKENLSTIEFASNDSTDWGNYQNASFDLTSTTGAKYSETQGAIWTNVNIVAYTKKGTVLLTTGANETRNSKQNICDLAGNIEEYTLGASPSPNAPCSGRGGSFIDSGAGYPAWYQNFYTTAHSDCCCGFRISLYK